jgi:hypothetical protein
VRKVLFENTVHFGEICHVVEEDVDLVIAMLEFRYTWLGEKRIYLDDPVHSDTRFGNNTLDVLTTHLGFIRNAAFNQVALCVGGNLA